MRQGLYRLNVVPDDATELIVRKGRVILSDSHTKVKGGNKVVFSATNVSVAKLTKEEKKQGQEEVDVWSKESAETLAKANRRISDRMLTSAFASFRDSDPYSTPAGILVLQLSCTLLHVPAVLLWVWFACTAVPIGLGSFTIPDGAANSSESGRHNGGNYPSGGGGSYPLVAVVVAARMEVTDPPCAHSGPSEREMGEAM